MGKIYIGTSGWSYPKGEGTWNGYFYPKGTKNELGFYSQCFNCVEINSSFYTPLNPAYVWNWVKKTPPDFSFTVKLWQKFTHPEMFEKATGKVASLSGADVDIFKRGIAPLEATEKLGAVLAQFPPGFINTDENKLYLEALLNTFSQYPLAVELRHRSWSDDIKTRKLLSSLDIAWVQIDEPVFKSSISQELPLTSSKLAYLRFHGRNAQDWWTGNAETRYRYLYSAEEINELAERVKKAAGSAQTTFAFFNNHWQGYAPKNATDMKQAIQSKLALEE